MPYLAPLLALWWQYSKFYILGALLVTHILNVTVKKVYLSPLLVNAISVLVLFLGIAIGLIKNDEIFNSIIFVYLPVVFSSIVMTVVIYIYRFVRRKIQ